MKSRLRKSRHMKSAVVILGVLASLQSSRAEAHGVSLAKATELVLHRIERLVILCNLGDSTQPVNLPSQPAYDPSRCKNDWSKPKKGIEPNYQNRLVAMTIDLIAHTEEEEPSFRGVAFQAKGPDGLQKSVTIDLDEEGRPVGKEIEKMASFSSVETFAWPDKDVTTLTENALHFVLEGAANLTLAPYFQGLSSLVVTPGKNAAGELVASVDMKISDQEPVLRVRIKPNGDFDSSEIVKE